jgi:hypothetical protein
MGIYAEHTIAIAHSPAGGTAGLLELIGRAFGRADVDQFSAEIWGYRFWLVLR